MLSSGSGAGSPPNPLRIVLNHLRSSSSKDHKQLSHEAARRLHGTSKDHQAAARATLRHLPMDKFVAGLIRSEPDPSTNPAAPDPSTNPAWPWDLLAASPQVTSWKLHPLQLLYMDDGYEQLAAAASKLRSLEVLGIEPHDDNMQALGRLLHACTQLEKVTITYTREVGMYHNPWKLLDPASSSLSSAVCPSIPLLSWESSGVPFEMMEHWLAKQQQQPGGTLTSLVMQKCGRILWGDFPGLAAVSGLRELMLDDISPSSLMALHSQGSANPLPALTRLCVPGDAVEAACGLTGLQHLSLKGFNIVLSSSLSSMQQLTCLEVIEDLLRPLDFARYKDCILPDDLGVWLPKLARLEGSVVVRGALPASLTALTHLRVASAAGRSTNMTLPFALPCLKELLLADGHKQPRTVHGALTGVAALEVLEGIRCSGLEILQPLTLLRRLAFEVTGGVTDPASLTVLGHLQQLSCLDVACLYKHSSALAAIGPLPALQQLTIGLCEPVDLGPWLAQCTALTKVCVVDRSWRRDDAAVDLGDLGYLPKQLQELRLKAWRWPQLPAGVMHLVGLKSLYVAAPVQRVRQGWASSGQCLDLPNWLSQLCHLELLDISCTQILTQPQAVLAHMPALRCVRLCPNAKAAKVFASALHLCFSDCSMSVEEWAAAVS